MKATSLVLATCFVSSVAAQDCTICANPVAGTISITYNGTLPIQQLWSDISVRMSGNGPVTILSESSNYTDVLSPNGAVITGNGTNEVTFVGSASGPVLDGVHTPDNPWIPLTFSYQGEYSSFSFEMFGQNTNTFVQAPFGNPINMINGNGSLGPMTFEILCIPSSASAALLGFAGIGAMRRRR